MKKHAKSRGRPRSDLTLNLRIFEMALLEGHSISKALFKAKIPMSTFYDFCCRNPEYSEKIRWFKDRLEQAAEDVLVEFLQDDDPRYRKERLEIAMRIHERAHALEMRRAKKPDILVLTEPQFAGHILEWRRQRAARQIEAPIVA